MPINKLTEHQQIKVKEIISEVFLFHGKPSEAVKRITKATGVTISERLVYYYLDQIKKEWVLTTQQNLDEVRAQELLKLELLEQELITAWNKSKKENQSTTEQTLPDGNVMTTKKRTGQTGHSPYVQALLNVQERRSKLLGLDTITKAQTTTNSDEDIVFQIVNPNEKRETEPKEQGTV